MKKNRKQFLSIPKSPTYNSNEIHSNTKTNTTVIFPSKHQKLDPLKSIIPKDLPRDSNLHFKKSRKVLPSTLKPMNSGQINIQIQPHLENGGSKNYYETTMYE
jgi:hypothetical protein